MSQGARLAAVLVVVAVAAIGLYFALVAPGGAVAPEPAPAGTVADPLAAPADPAAPPAEAFAIPASSSGVAAAEPSGTPPVTAPAAGPAPVASAAVLPADQGAPAAGVPTARSYTIKSGDTLEGIARRELGDGQRWRQIVEANPGLDPKALKVGRSISLPEAGAATATTEPKASTGVGSGEGGSSGSSYTVQKGDTLFAIARKVYGSGSDAEVKRIVSANPGVLKSKDTPLKPGMKLAIPAKR